MRYRFEAVPGKEHTFIVIDKETDKQINICDVIMADIAAGKGGKKYTK